VTRAVRAAFAIGLGVAGALPAAAWIPEPERAWTLLAQSNLQSARAAPLDFAVALVDAVGNVAATGRLRAEPGGVARLELALADGGGTEVHERNGAGEYRVTRNGQRIERAPKLLPPFAALQADKAMEVADALRASGGDPARVDLGIEGRSDCWVLGGRDPGDFQMNTRPSIWVDQETRQPVRIDDAGGVRYRLLDLSPKGGVRFPSRIEVRADGWPIWRLDVATPAPPQARPPGVETAP
jgi:hypothetical protein